MAQQGSKSDAPTPAQARRAVQVFGIINIVLGLYVILGALAAVKGVKLPLSAGAQFAAKTIGLILVLLAWGSGVVGGIGLVLRSAWGRKLATIWGRAIVWVLPICFGLAANGLKSFISLDFAIIIAICFYAQILAGNLARSEFDVGFE